MAFSVRKAAVPGATAQQKLPPNAICKEAALASLARESCPTLSKGRPTRAKNGQRRETQERSGTVLH